MGLMVQEEKSFEEDPNETILAILNLLCQCDASHQVLAQSDFRFERRCCLKNFKMAPMAAIFIIIMEGF